MYNNSDNNNAARSNHIRNFLFGMLACFIAVGLVMLIVWLVFRPTLPKFHVVDLSVYDLQANGSVVRGGWDVKFFVRNPNKRLRISYIGVEYIILYRGNDLRRSPGSDLQQGKKARTNVMVSFPYAGSVVHPLVVTEINKDLWGYYSDGFEVEFNAYVGFSPSVFRPKLRLMKVHCPVRLQFTSKTRGYLSGPVLPCTVVG